MNRGRTPPRCSTGEAVGGSTRPARPLAGSPASIPAARAVRLDDAVRLLTETPHALAERRDFEGRRAQPSGIHGRRLSAAWNKRSPPLETSYSDASRCRHLVSSVATPFERSSVSEAVTKRGLTKADSAGASRGSTVRVAVQSATDVRRLLHAPARLSRWFARPCRRPSLTASPKRESSRSISVPGARMSELRSSRAVSTAS